MKSEEDSDDASSNDARCSNRDHPERAYVTGSPKIANQKTAEGETDEESKTHNAQPSQQDAKKSSGRKSPQDGQIVATRPSRQEAENISQRALATEFKIDPESPFSDIGGRRVSASSPQREAEKNGEPGAEAAIGKGGSDVKSEASSSSEADQKLKCSQCCKYCCIFFAKLCCPPGVCCVTSVVSNRMAFMPPRPTYEACPLFEMMEHKGKSEKWKKRHRSAELDYCLALKPEARWPFDDVLLRCIKVHFVKTERKKAVMCMFIRCVERPRYTILFSHGNGSDLGQMAAFMLRLGLFLRCNVFTYDYTGYGESKGRPSAKNVYADADAAWLGLQTQWGVGEETIILCGQSLGSAPTIRLAAKKKVAGIVIISGFMSILSVVCAHRMKGCFGPGRRCVGCCDILVNINECDQIESPVLVIHGTADRIIKINHGQKLFESCRNTVAPLWIKGADHNDTLMWPSFWIRLKCFVDVDLAQGQFFREAAKQERSEEANFNLNLLHIAA